MSDFDSLAPPREQTLQPEFWRTRRVLTTGRRGFLGRHIVDRLQALPVGELTLPRRHRSALEPRHPASIRRTFGAKQTGTESVQIRAVGASREFLDMDGFSRGILLAAGRCARPEPVRPGRAAGSGVEFRDGLDATIRWYEQSSGSVALAEPRG